MHTHTHTRTDGSLGKSRQSIIVIAVEFRTGPEVEPCEWQISCRICLTSSNRTSRNLFLTVRLIKAPYHFLLSLCRLLAVDTLQCVRDGMKRVWKVFVNEMLLRRFVYPPHGAELRRNLQIPFKAMVSIFGVAHNKQTAFYHSTCCRSSPRWWNISNYGFLKNENWLNWF